MDLLSVRHKQISVHIFYSFYYNSNKFPGDIFLIFLRFCLSIFFAWDIKTATNKNPGAV